MAAMRAEGDTPATKEWYPTEKVIENGVEVERDLGFSFAYGRASGQSYTWIVDLQSVLIGPAGRMYRPATAQIKEGPPEEGVKL